MIMPNSRSLLAEEWMKRQEARHLHTLYIFPRSADQFATIIQPALGVLMIGSIAGQFFQEEENDVQGM